MHIMQAYVESQKLSLQPSQPSAAPADEEESALHDADGELRKQAGENGRQAQGQKQRREMLSQLLSKVQASAALLVDPLLDAGMCEFPTSLCLISRCSLCACNFFQGSSTCWMYPIE